MVNFDPAASFLLTMQWPNLYEPARVDELDKQTYRCKGCATIVARADREKHYRRHIKQQQRENEKHREQIRRERIKRLQAVRP